MNLKTDKYQQQFTLSVHIYSSRLITKIIINHVNTRSLTTFKLHNYLQLKLFTKKKMTIHRYCRNNRVVGSIRTVQLDPRFQELDVVLI